MRFKPECYCNYCCPPNLPAAAQEVSVARTVRRQSLAGRISLAMNLLQYSALATEGQVILPRIWNRGTSVA